ncbi:MAG TPA: hypothetical protein VKW06_11550 [Candidatus Angelobacter sp.]|nr:hypothetical protein [Candidatus Angelobacter sp.]
MIKITEWKMFKRQAPAAAITGNIVAKKQFQRLWVAGSLGAFFTSLARTLPGDIRNVTVETAPHTVLRYLYMIWFISYFFVSNLRTQSNEIPEVREIPFDVIQSIAGLTAAFFLDFLVTNEHHGISAFAAASFAIAAICGFALFWFRRDEPGLQIARLIGFLLALCVGIAIMAGYVASWMLWTSVAILFLLLAMFTLIRIKGPEVSTTPLAGPAKKVT